MDIKQILIWGGLVPASIVLVIMLLAWRVIFTRAAARAVDPDDIPDHGAGPHWVLPLSLALGFLPAFISLEGSIELWPNETIKRFAHIGFAAAFVGIAEALRRPGLIRLFLARLGVFVFAGWAILEALFRNGQMSSRELAMTVGIMALLALLTSLILDRASRRLPMLVTAAALAVGFVVTSASLFELAHLGSLARLAGAMIAMLCSLAIASVWCKGPSLDRGGSVVVVAMLLSLLTAGRWFGGSWGDDGRILGLPWISLIGLLLSPAALAVALVPPIARRGIMVRGSIALLAISVVAGSSAIAGWWLLPAPPENPYADF